MDIKKRKRIAARLEQIEGINGGRITPEAVVEDARDPESPLHDLFLWDDTEAAHQYRLSQARGVIRSIKVDIRVDRRTVSTVKYVRDESANSHQGYVAVAKLRTESELARATVQAELKQVRARLQRARDIADVLGLTEELEALLAQVAHLAERAAA